MATCACEISGVEACSTNCSCRTPVLSGGCRRCATYGSDAQRLDSARRIAASDATLARLEAQNEDMELDLRALEEGAAQDRSEIERQRKYIDDLQQKLETVRAAWTSSEDDGVELAKDVDRLEEEVERLKNGLHEIVSAGFSSRSKDYLHLPGLARKILDGGTSSHAFELIQAHVKSHNETRAKLKETELQADKVAMQLHDAEARAELAGEKRRFVELRIERFRKVLEGVAREFANSGRDQEPWYRDVQLALDASACDCLCHGCRDVRGNPISCACCPRGTDTTRT